MEKWVDCYGWEGLYQVSDIGNVRSLERVVKNNIGFCKRGGKNLKKIIATTGYEVVNLSSKNGKKQCLVHRLVLLSFLGDKYGKNQACHGNGIRNDNSLSNLRWGDAKDNCSDRGLHGTNIFGEKSPNAKLTEKQASEIKHSGEFMRKLARDYGVSRAAIKAIKSGKNWAHVP